MILVTGATGTVGREVVRVVRDSGLAVRAAVRDPQAARALLGEGLEYVRFQFGRPSTYAAAFANVRAMFLMRPPSITNVRGVIEPAVNAAGHAGLKHVTFLSVQGAQRNVLVPHYRIERHLERSGLHYTLLRPAFFMQNLSTTHAADIRERDEIFLPAGRGKTAFIDARDVGAIAARTLTESGHDRMAYELTGREALDYRQAATIFGRVLRRRIVYADPSPLAFWQRMRQRGQPAAYVGVMLALYSVVRFGLASHLSPQAEQLLGRAPLALEQFVRDYARVWQPDVSTRAPERGAIGHWCVGGDNG